MGWVQLSEGDAARLCATGMNDVLLRCEREAGVEHVDAGVGDVGVEEVPAFVGHDGERFLERARRPVGAGCGNRLHGVGHGEDPSLEQDLVAVQALRVPGAVEAFVVLQDHRGDRPREVDADDDVVTGRWVTLDQ